MESIDQVSCLHLNATERSLIETLLDADVEFVIVGGQAVVFHGHMRAIDDLDIFCRPSLKNAAGIIKALRYFQIPLDDESEGKLAKRGFQLRLNIHGNNVEFLTSLAEVTWDEAFRQAEQWLDGNRSVLVLSKEHLIKSKLALTKSKHSDDVGALRAL